MLKKRRINTGRQNGNNMNIRLVDKLHPQRLGQSCDGKFRHCVHTHEWRADTADDGADVHQGAVPLLAKLSRCCVVVLHSLPFMSRDMKGRQGPRTL